MFRGSSRSRGEAPVAVTQQEFPAPRESSNWRPALRRIKRGLFPKSSVQEKTDIGKPERTDSPKSQTLVEIHQQRLNERNTRPSTANQPEISRGYSQSNAYQPDVLRKQRPVPMGPREPNEPSKFNFVKRSLSRSNSKRRSIQEPREPIFVMRDIKRDQVEIISAGPPSSSTAAYVPRHAAADFQKISSNQSQQPQNSSIPRKPVPGQIQAPEKAAYQPKHAASDFSKLKLPFTLDSNGLAQHPSDQNMSTVHNPSRMSDADLDDYQSFLKASRLAAAGNYNSYGVISSSNFTPKTSQLMQEIISNQQSLERERERERAYAMSQRSVASKQGSKAGSIFDRMAEYVRPGRTGSIRSQRTGFTSIDDKGSLRSSIIGDDESRRGGGRWRRVGGSIRRSFLRDRDRDGVDIEVDEKEGGDLRGRKRRSRIMPLSGGLKRFNQAVANGGY
ncbi:hypothetical protein ONS95_011146 [Cadophora gregata]|uniref:uncharacterized protein n=1 Tax=Cadophora gregata TaxID=51156 RepID=UPI0026DB2A45|nr:uncharacterized protein ONS95_011146 [Cadophora gregata]KAK0119711.1 hypothetical protein ONS95_011146 [Cadophora gregata]